MKINASSALLLLLVGACSSSGGSTGGGTSGAGGQLAGHAGSGGARNSAAGADDADGGASGNGGTSNVDGGAAGASGNGGTSNVDGGAAGASGNGGTSNVDGGAAGASGSADSATGGAAGRGDAGAAGSGAAGSGGAGSGSECPQGTWKAVQYSCGSDDPAPIPSVTTFTFGIDGTKGTFAQANNIGSFSCTNSNAGPVTCAGDSMTFDTGTTQCSPAECLSKSECGAAGPLVLFTFTQPSANELVTTTPVETELTTCSSLGKNNPVTFYWEKQ